VLESYLCCFNVIGFAIYAKMHFSYVSQFAFQIPMLMLIQEDVSPKQCVEHLITKKIEIAQCHISHLPFLGEIQ
jgi:hypothetical protein